MVLWNIMVTNIGSDSVPDAKVCLFIGGVIRAPEEADYTQDTINGVAAFDVPAGFYKVGVVAPGYESAYEPHNPPEEWKDVWTCWGAGGAGYDYDFAVTPKIISNGGINLWVIPLIISATVVSIIGAVFVKKRRK